MVNRDINFNRKYTKRLLTIRNKKRCQMGPREKTLVEEKKPKGYTKKMAKRQNRYDTMRKNLKIDVADLFKKGKKSNKKKINKRNNKKEEKMKMEIE